MGLILVVKFRSVRRISEEFSSSDPSALNHFLTDSPWEARDLIRRSQVWVRPRLAGSLVQFIIDDTTLERNGPAIEGTGLHHSGNRLVKGHCAVTAGVLAGDEKYLWDVRGYRPKAACESGSFKSKVDLAVEIIEDADLGHNHVLALFDAWFTCRAVAEALRARNWRFLAALKRNRIVYIGRTKHRVSNLAKGPREYVSVKCGRHRFRMAKIRAYLHGLGEVALFIVKSATLGTRFLVTSDLNLSAKAAVVTYARRFWIETQFREAKQHFGMGELFLRKWRGVPKHWALVMAAYNAVQAVKHSPAAVDLKTTGAVLRRLQKSFRTRNVKIYIAELLSKVS